MGMPDSGRIDADTHLYETRDLWVEYADPGDRDRALRLEDDDLGYTWLTLGPGGRRIHLAEVHTPGDVAAMGAYRRRQYAGEPPPVPYDVALPEGFWNPAVRRDDLDRLGAAEAVVFPNFGLLIDRPLGEEPDALAVNLAAWNRWAVDVAAEGKGRLHPVGHVALHDAEWLDGQLAALSAGGVRLAMVPPALVGGQRLSHPDLDRCWAAFVEHGVTPAFHVEAFPHPFADAWYEGDPDPVNPVLSSVFLWTGPALCLADMALGGVFERHPDLRLGVFEFSAVWVPEFLMYLDGGFDFHARFNGAPIEDLSMRPSEYLRRHTRVACFGYEGPKRLIDLAGEDLFMFSSDWPHAEGAGDPAADFESVASHVDGRAAEQLFRGNLEFLLQRV